jgi:hypothetical protein
LNLQTENFKTKIRRYKLIPVTKEDKARLLNLEGSASVIPLDREHGIDGLPFRMSVKTMLLVCRIALKSPSFEAASQTILADRGFKLSPATILGVTNHIGKIVFERECSEAELAYGRMKSGERYFSQDRQPGALYIMPDGGMFNTKAKNPDNDSTWRESKLAIIYRASDILPGNVDHGNLPYHHNIFCWSIHPYFNIT